MFRLTKTKANRLKRKRSWDLSMIKVKDEENATYRN